MLKTTPKPMKEGAGPVSFSDEVWISAPVERVWQLVTKGAWLDRWFTTFCTGNLDVPGRIRMSWGTKSEPVEVLASRWEQSTTFRWVAFGVPYATRVRIAFEKKKRLTRVRLTERGWKRDSKGVVSALHHAIGWTHFLCALKAYAQFGVEMRG